MLRSNRNEIHHKRRCRSRIFLFDRNSDSFATTAAPDKDNYFDLVSINKTENTRRKIAQTLQSLTYETEPHITRLLQDKMKLDLNIHTF